MGSKQSASPSSEIDVTDMLKYEFHGPLNEKSDANGLCFDGTYLPEEIVALILSYVDPQHVLKATLVCKKWCNIIKSSMFWVHIYKRRYRKQPKKLPWYVFYCHFATNLLDNNLLKNGNGQEGFEHWERLKDEDENNGNDFIIEKVPTGADPLPLDVPEFNGQTSCFATSYRRCIKRQKIDLSENKLLLYIVNKFQPDIYFSEWVAGRFDCGCIYELSCAFTYKNQVRHEKRRVQKFQVAQWEGKAWKKVELLVPDYCLPIDGIIFHHMGKDTQFWAGHYGSKMAGGVVKILMDSIKMKH